MLGARRKELKNLKEQWIYSLQATLEKIELDQKFPLFMEGKKKI